MISEAGAQWAIQFVEHCTKFVLRAVRENVADNQHQREVLKVLKIIRKGRHAGVTQGQLTKALNHTHKARELRDLILSLSDSGEIVVRTRATSTKPAQVMIASEFAD